MTTAIKIAPFGPIVPRTAERLLSEGFAQVADNVNLLSGEIRPIRRPYMTDAALADSEAVFRAEYLTSEKWRGWTMDVDIATVPLAPEVEYRYVWTGDGGPKWNRFSTFQTVASDLSLGVPAPLAAPAVAPSGGVGAATSRLYVYTFWSADGEESAPSPASALTTGKVDDTWAITGMSAFPLSTGNISAAALDTPSNGYTQVTVSAANSLRVGDVITIAGVLGMTDLNGVRTVAGIVSPTIFYVALDTSQIYSAGGTWTRDAPWNTVNMTRRLYRSAGTNATYQLVAENISATTYNDNITDANIPGDELISADWLPPPATLFNVVSLPSGALAGISGSTLYMSEPYQPHAWPLSYQFGLAYPAVALAAYGTVAVVGTLGQPYMADGVDPASVSLERVDSVWPCLSKRSMCSVGDGVIYATSHGMAYVGAAGPRIWSQPYYTREEWQALLPSSMISATTEGKVFVRYKTATDVVSHILLFMPQEPSASLTRLHIDCVELYADARNGKLYVVDSEGLKEYDADAGFRLVYQWRSKEYELPKPVNFGAARVEFVSEMTAADVTAAQAAYDAAVAAQPAKIAGGVGAINGRRVGLNNNSAINGYTPTLPPIPDAAYVNFTLYADGEPIFGAVLFDNEAFTLPAGYKSDSYSVQLDGTVRVKNVKIAETMSGLSKV
jgi:hypothetical protein